MPPPIHSHILETRVCYIQLASELALNVVVCVCVCRWACACARISCCCTSIQMGLLWRPRWRRWRRCKVTLCVTHRWFDSSQRKPAPENIGEVFRFLYLPHALLAYSFHGIYLKIIRRSNLSSPYPNNHIIQLPSKPVRKVHIKEFFKSYACFSYMYYTCK